MPHYLRLFMQQDRCRCRCCRRVRWRGRGHVLCMHDESQKAPQSALCCLCPAVCNIMLHKAHGAAACNNKKLMMMKLQLQSNENLNFCALLNLTTRWRGGRGEWGSSFRYSPYPLTHFVGLSLSRGCPHFLAAVYFICCKQNSSPLHSPP